MKYLPLILGNLKRHRLRNVLTVLSVAAAMFLFASLRSFETTLDSISEAGSDTRMVVRNATGLVFPLPMSYAQRLAAVEDDIKEIKGELTHFRRPVIVK